MARYQTWALRDEYSRVDKVGGFGIFWGMNRLTIEIEPEQHRQIKTLATFAGMTIKEFILSKTITPSSVRPQQSADTTTRLLEKVSVPLKRSCYPSQPR